LSPAAGLQDVHDQVRLSAVHCQYQSLPDETAGALLGHRFQGEAAVLAGLLRHLEPQRCRLVEAQAVEIVPDQLQQAGRQRRSRPLSRGRS
jgi:hypothetical protein